MTIIDRAEKFLLNCNSYKLIYFEEIDKFDNQKEQMSKVCALKLLVFGGNNILENLEDKLFHYNEV